MCDGTNNSQECFGGMNQASMTAEQFQYPAFGSTNTYELNSGTTRLGRTPNTAAVNEIQTAQTHSGTNGSKTVFSLGIPTGVLSIDVAEITDPTTQYPNQLVWAAETSTGTGKQNTAALRGQQADGVTDNDETNMYLYWAIQDAPQAFWEMDLVTVARHMRDNTLTGTTYGARLQGQGITLY